MKPLAVPVRYTVHDGLTQKPQNKRGCVKMMHPLFRYIIIVLPFFIEYDLCFSYVHAFWWYNVL